jgi:hypothetical protein
VNAFAPNGVGGGLALLVKELVECICMGRIAGEEGEQSQLIDATSCVKMYNAGKLGYISSHQIKSWAHTAPIGVKLLTLTGCVVTMYWTILTIYFTKIKPKGFNSKQKDYSATL